MQNYPNSSVLYDLLMSVLGKKPMAPGEPPPLDKEPDYEQPPAPPMRG
jgi:hypothetical protein